MYHQSWFSKSDGTNHKDKNPNYITQAPVGSEQISRIIEKASNMAPAHL